MEKRSDIQIEMDEISPAVASIYNTNVYTVPENYFNNFAVRLMLHVDMNGADAAFLTQPPAGYFNGLADAILSRIKKEDTSFITNEAEQELHEVAPLLATISKANVYSIPANYFADFKVTPLKAAPAKVLPLMFKKWTGFAAAAVTAGVIVMAAFFFNTNTDHGRINVDKSVAAISDNEINNYLDKTSESNDIAVSANYELQPNEDTDVEDFINLTPDKDIEDYLQTNSEPGENGVKGI